MNVVFALNLILTKKRLLRLPDLHVALGINLRMSESGKNWLLLPTPVCTTYSRRLQPSQVYKTYSGKHNLYSGPYSIQSTISYTTESSAWINLLQRTQLLEHLTPSSPSPSPLPMQRIQSSSSFK